MSEDVLIRLFSDTLGVPAEELDEETSPDNTSSWDSLRSMQLVAVVEETFDVRLSTKDIMKMRTIGIVREVLKAKDVEGL
jgi:acyl carrier protein